jgi:hypothetical protein
MSYATMDHAGWVEQNAGYAKKQSPKRRADNTKGWAAAPERLNEFQAKVMDILGMVAGGIYNAPIAWDAVQWTGWGHGIAVPWRSGNCFSTFDGSPLTRLVFLCHEARIRGEIRIHSPGYFLLCFWPRVAEGGIGERHPSLDEAVASFRAYLPDDHRVIYRQSASVEG